jgi:hypothetical protein
MGAKTLWGFMEMRKLISFPGKAVHTLKGPELDVSAKVVREVNRDWMSRKH